MDAEIAVTEMERQAGEREKSEILVEEHDLRLREIMDHTADGIITIGEYGIIESFNAAASRMFGYSEEEACGQNVSILMPEPYCGKHDGFLENYRRTGKGGILGIGPREVVGMHKSASTFPAELAVSEMLLGGNKRSFIGIIRDITQRKEAEVKLQQTQKLEAIGQLTGGIAHDFNNLLTVILGNLDLAKNQIGDSASWRNSLDVSIGAALRAADLTQRLLAYSRKQTLDTQPTDINKIVQDSIELARWTLREDIEIETVLGAGVWPAMIDPGQLGNSLLNLCINSSHAMAEGGKLTIETANAHIDQAYANEHNEVKPGQYVMVAVTDTGVGMPPEVVERAFDPFFTTKEVGQGTGLGLSMIYGFTKQSGGHIKIYSEVDQGTTIKLYLPKAANAAAGARPSQLAKRAMPMGTETILIVEDDPDVRAFVVIALRVLGYNILEAGDGPAALELLEGGPHIDLLLTDVVLPGGMNGRQVGEQVRRQFPNVKLLYSSGYTENAIIRGQKLDQDAQLLPKPYTREALAIKVREILDIPEAS
jgi:PAS domain S-box-containing protein